MRLLAKSSCSQMQLEDRITKGFKHLEIQLTSDFFKVGNIETYENILSVRWDVQHIHMPFIPGESDLPLEFIGYPEHTRIFFKVCNLAQRCAKYYNHPISIIIHTNIPHETMKYLPNSLEKIIEIFKIAINQSPDIIFSIENGALYSVKQNDIRINPSSFDANVQWANFLNNKLKTNRFKTTVDICHLLMTRKAMEFLTTNSETAPFEKTIDWFFQQNKDTINNIHLNNMHMFGLKGDHSETFDESNVKDMEILTAIIMLYKQYNLDCNITLEVEENDHSNALNAEKLNKLLRQLMSRY